MTTSENYNLTKRIMRRVYALWFLRRVAPIVFLEMPFLLVVAAFEISRSFFVVKIVDNFIATLHSPNGFYGALNFISSALYHAPLMSVSIVALSAGLLLFLAYRLFRNLTAASLVNINIS